MRNLLKLSTIIGVFAFGVAFALSGNAFAWNPYCPHPDKSVAAVAALPLNAMSLVSIQKQNSLPAAVERKIFRRVRRWIHDGCPGAFTGEGAEHVWNLSPISVGGVVNRMREDAFLVGYTDASLVFACSKAREAKVAREREANLNKKFERLFILLSRMEGRLDRLERNQ